MDLSIDEERTNVKRVGVEFEILGTVSAEIKSIAKMGYALNTEPLWWTPPIWMNIKLCKGRYTEEYEIAALERK